jgi:hypothetical protein
VVELENADETGQIIKRSLRSALVNLTSSEPGRCGESCRQSSGGDERKIHRRCQENLTGTRVACSDVVAGLSTIELLRGSRSHAWHESLQFLSLESQTGSAECGEYHPHFPHQREASQFPEFPQLSSKALLERLSGLSRNVVRIEF